MTGDWNAKVGKKIKHHASDNCIGSFASGVRNNSGQYLVNFCPISTQPFNAKLPTYLTTWENKRVHPKDLTKSIAVYNQIDYILCSEKIKHTLVNARSFSNTETSSDHRLVICKLQVERYNNFKNVNETHTKGYNTFQLIKSEETKNDYQQQLHENLCKMECTSWENIRGSITDAATKTIGFTKNNKNHRIYNPVAERLSNQQKELRLRISSTVNTEKVRELKTQRNRKLHDIANMLNEDTNRELDNLASEIDKFHNDNTKMYQAIKFINRKPLQNLMVHGKAGRNVTELNAVYNIIIETTSKHISMTRRNQNYTLSLAFQEHQ